MSDREKRLLDLGDAKSEMRWREGQALRSKMTFLCLTRDFLFELNDMPRVINNIGEAVKSEEAVKKMFRLYNSQLNT